jgi:hypothetical protein
MKLPGGFLTAETAHRTIQKMTRSGDLAGRAKLYRSGPFLVVYGSGPGAEDVALDIASQCAARDVHAEVRAIDEVSQVCTWHFLALIAVLPSSPGMDLAGALRPFKR